MGKIEELPITYERYYKCHAEWIGIKPRGWVSFLKEDGKSRGYMYYKPLNGILYRSKINQ